MIQTNWFGSGFKLRAAITVACQIAFVFFGYDQGVFSGIIGNEDFMDTFGHPNASLEGIIVGAALQTSAFTVPHIMIARFITGIGTGIETSTVPMYQSELCEAERRGRLVSSEPLFVGVGIEIAYWFDYGMNFVGGPIAWRLPVACQMIFAFVVIIMVFGLPESPRYLYAHGKDAEALAVLCKVYDRPPDDPKIVKEQEEIFEALQVEREHGEYRWSQLLKRDEVQTGRRVLLAYGMQFMNQMGGINLVVYYITTVLQTNVGLSRNLSLLLGGAINAMFFLGSLFPTFFLDKYGRRKPMIWGSFGLGISMMLISILLSFQESHPDTQLAKTTAAASVTFFFTYMLIFGATANCIPWVYVPEILPLHVRAKGTAVGISSNWLWNFFVVMVTPTLLANLAWKGYLIFMALNFAFIPLLYFCYPETTNLTLEEVDWLFLEKNAVKTSRAVQKKGWGGETPWQRRENRVHAQEKDSEHGAVAVEHGGDAGKGLGGV
ncbi:Sugar transporter STL1 [Cytospora mali]|uniref:Sugar transporter STL1 n=1 Tax=Cytospora mali TaxID=578113 RepID=A0A194VFU6_CYTMA|nr:Sugar transporter STL1 [Valsa mali var. pyri (nom. inval.)]